MRSSINRNATPAETAPPNDTDIRELVSVLRELTGELKPLAEHVPVLVDMAAAWSKASTTGKTIGWGARMLAGFMKWVTIIGGGFGVLWVILHANWIALLERH